MLKLKVEGKVINTPELKVSVKGTHYLKFTVESMNPNGRWSDRVYVTMFGEDAINAARQIPTPGYFVEIIGKPEVRAYKDKMGEPKGVQELIGRQWRVVQAPVQQPQQQQNSWTPPDERFEISAAITNALKQEPKFTDDDIPF